MCTPSNPTRYVRSSCGKRCNDRATTWWCTWALVVCVPAPIYEHTMWSVLSSEVTKCDTNIRLRRLITHLLHQMVHYRTNRRGSGHWSATIKRDNIRTINQTKVPTKSKITSESCAMVSFLWRPWTTGKVGCRTATYSTSSGTKFGSSSVKTRQEWVYTYSTSPTTPAEGNNKDHARIYQGWG
jgi:hypothetical protein